MTPDGRAWHEAGHALAAHLLGGVIREVTLESEHDAFEAHVAVEWERTDPANDARRFATVALAGPVAELTFRGEEVLDDPKVFAAWSADWDECSAQLERLEPREEARDALRREILRELHARFDEPDTYEQLARIADALDAHETLDETLFADALGLD